MFEKLKIHNFQSHKDTEFEFVPGINVIIGTSDSGKSAVFRALRWLMYNRPSGDSFCSYWSDKETRVELQLDDHVIVRARDKNKQLYELDSLAFTAFKTEVPEEITKALNMGEVNFQQQFDRPFLLDVSSGEVAQYFNRIAHLENIDLVLKTLHQKERENKRSIEWYTAEKAKVENEITKYDDLDTIEKKVSVLERIEKGITEVQIEVDNMGDLLFQLRQLQTELVIAPSVAFLLKEITDILLLETECNLFQAILNSNKEAVIEITKLQGIDKCSLLIEEMLGITQGVLEIEAYTAQITSNKDTLTLVKSTISSLGEEIVKLETEYKESTPPICPLCGSKN